MFKSKHRSAGHEHHHHHHHQQAQKLCGKRRRSAPSRRFHWQRQANTYTRSYRRMDGDKSYDHVKALVSSIHGSFTDATLLDRTNNNSPAGGLQVTATSTPSRTPSPDVLQNTSDNDGSGGPASGQERAAADGAAATPTSQTVGSETGTGAQPIAANSNSGSTPTRLLQHRLRIPSLVVTSSLSPYHPSNLLAAASADTDHTPRRFSFAIMRRHSNTKSLHGVMH
uniref:Uncharacterized protein n=1 Tax=Anopheles farauti TaxID=69004 RepID=A0A182QG35_9DIPT